MKEKQPTKAQLRRDVEALHQQMVVLQSTASAYKRADVVLRQAYDTLELRMQTQAAELLAANAALQVSTTQRTQAEQELQHTKEELESAYEELELSREELHTTYQKLQTSVNAFQSIERETRFINQDRQTLNEAVRRGVTELKRTNTFLESVLTSLRAGMVVVDQDLCVLTWNRGAERLWGLMVEEVQGQPFLELPIGLPVAQLSDTLRSCLAGECARREVVLGATNSRLQAITCRVTCTPLYSTGKENRGVIMLMEQTGR